MGDSGESDGEEQVKCHGSLKKDMYGRSLI